MVGYDEDSTDEEIVFIDRVDKKEIIDRITTQLENAEEN